MDIPPQYDLELLKSRCVIHHGKMSVCNRTLKPVVRNEYWTVNGVIFNHCPTEDEILETCVVDHMLDK